MGKKVACWLQMAHVLLVVAYMCVVYVGNLLLVFPALEGGFGLCYVVCYNVLGVMVSWSFLAVVIKDPGRPRDGGNQFDWQSLKAHYCLTCQTIKPERCHHCTACNRCIIEMDHHCPWVNNCVGFDNRKQFILLLVYTLLITILGCLGMLRVYELNWVFLGLMAANDVMMFLLGWFLSFHLRLLSQNLTTLENILIQQRVLVYQFLLYWFKSENEFDVGAYENIVQIFGQNRWLWLLPIKSNTSMCENGHKFPHKQQQQQLINQQVTTTNYQQQQQQQQQLINQQQQVTTILKSPLPIIHEHQGTTPLFFTLPNSHNKALKSKLSPLHQRYTNRTQKYIKFSVYNNNKSLDMSEQISVNSSRLRIFDKLKPSTPIK